MKTILLNTITLGKYIACMSIVITADVYELDAPLKLTIILNVEKNVGKRIFYLILNLNNFYHYNVF